MVRIRFAVKITVPVVVVAGAGPPVEGEWDTTAAVTIPPPALPAITPFVRWVVVIPVGDLGKRREGRIVLSTTLALRIVPLVEGPSSVTGGESVART